MFFDIIQGLGWYPEPLPIVSLVIVTTVHNNTSLAKQLCLFSFGNTVSNI